MLRKITNVRMGEWKVCQAPGKLTTIGLGSCVGLVLYDASMRIGGIAHIMLPEKSSGHRTKTTNTIDNFSQPAKFACSVIEYMLKRMEYMGSNKANIRASLIGGANMFPDVIKDSMLDVGKRNVERLRMEIATYGIPLIREEVGGSVGRCVSLNLENGEVILTDLA